MSSIAWGQLHKDATTVLEGEFLAVLENVKAAQSQNGNPCCKGVAKITAGPYAGRTIPVNFTLTDKSAGMFFANMNALGLDGEFFAKLEAQGLGMEAVAAALNGVTAEIVVEKRPWNGQDRENVKSWKRTSATGLPIASGIPTAVAVSVPAATPVAVALPAADSIAPPVAPGEDDGDPF